MQPDIYLASHRIEGESRSLFFIFFQQAKHCIYHWHTKWMQLPGLKMAMMML